MLKIVFKHSPFYCSLPDSVARLSAKIRRPKRGLHPGLLVAGLHEIETQMVGIQTECLCIELQACQSSIFLPLNQ